MIDRKYFFDKVRPFFPGGKLTPQQVGGLEVKLQVWEQYHANEPLDFLANGLAQMSWETGYKMVPRREADYLSPAAQRAYLMKNYDRTGIKPSRAIEHGNTRVGDGFTFGGTGDIQLTWASNFLKMGSLLGVDLYNNPGLAMDPVISARIAFYGMINGFFTGRSLRQYFNSTKNDPAGARAVVNGDTTYLVDKKVPAKGTIGQEIARRHKFFKSALRDIAGTTVTHPIVTTPVVKLPAGSTTGKPAVIATAPAPRPVTIVQPTLWEVMAAWFRGV